MVTIIWVKFFKLSKFGSHLQVTFLVFIVKLSDFLFSCFGVFVLHLFKLASTLTFYTFPFTFYIFTFYFLHFFFYFSVSAAAFPQLLGSAIEDGSITTTLNLDSLFYQFHLSTFLLLVAFCGFCVLVFFIFMIHIPDIFNIDCE